VVRIVSIDFDASPHGDGTARSPRARGGFGLYCLVAPCSTWRLYAALSK
jgi:hypothetical protein